MIHTSHLPTFPLSGQCYPSRFSASHKNISTAEPVGLNKVSLVVSLNGTSETGGNSLKVNGGTFSALGET